jgi:hypothetical protein
MTGDNKENKISEQQAKDALLGDTAEIVESGKKDENTGSEKNSEEVLNTKEPLDLGLGVVKTDEVISAEDRKEYAKEAKTIGFVDLFPDKFPSECKYYGVDWRFRIKSATFDEVKDYSSMREEDIYDVDEHLQRIMESNIEITRGKLGRGSYKDLSQTDKIFSIFAVRDRTMMTQQREKKIFQTVECPHDGHKNKVEINNDIFDYYKIPAGITKWYNDIERCFIIDDKSLGEQPLKIFIPTVGVIQHISEYIKYMNQKKQAGDGGFFNQHHLDMASFLVKDWRSLDAEFNTITNIMHQIKNVWNYDRFQTMSKAVAKINYGIKPIITIKCGASGCGKEVSAPARFPGFKSLFDLSPKSDELLSDSE